MLSGLHLFSLIVDLWSRPSLTLEDVENLGSHALKFYTKFESKHYRYDNERVGLAT